MKLKFVLYMLIAALDATKIGAATLNFDAVDGTTDRSGNFVSPYSGRVDGVFYQLYCDDFLHDILIPDVETVNISNLNNLSLTRFGGQTAAISLYEQVFYLSTLLGNASYSRGDVQDAIWSVFSPSNYPNESNSNVRALVSQAQMNYSGRNYSSFYILTDAADQFGGKQELFINASISPPTITSIPEPASWALFLTALGVLAIVRSQLNTCCGLQSAK